MGRTAKSANKIRVMVVDDSAYNRQTIKTMLQTDPLVEVVGVASDGVDAIAKTLRLKPDIITLDFEMPEMDGFSFLRWLIHERPTPVIMVSSYSNKNMAIKALEFGAVDFIQKPTRRASGMLRNIEKDLLSKVHAAMNTNMDLLAKNMKLLSDVSEEAEVEEFASPYDIIAIGSSTGGPAALQIILTHIPREIPASIVISQHMPKGFTAPLAKRLNSIAWINIVEASDGDELRQGTALICPGGSHMEVQSTKKGRKWVKIVEASDDDKYVPSVDALMSSVAKAYSERSLGIMLTGMGNDGSEGMLEMKAQGSHTVAESEETAIVFGMPNEAIKIKAVNTILPVDRIAEHIRAKLMGERRT